MNVVLRQKGGDYMLVVHPQMLADYPEILDGWEVADESS